MSIDTTDPAKSTDVDLYEALSLDKDDATEAIRAKLHTLKLSWTARAAKAGARGKEAQRTLELVARAEEVFADDDAREAYDLSMRRKPADVAIPDADIDWLGRAWSYYFLKDDGAAAVAARKAREVAPNDALVYVVSAWINLRDNEQKRAKADADEAFVLDELGDDTADVHHVRGVVFTALGNYDKARESLTRALLKASEDERPEILFHRAFAHQGKEDYRQMYDDCAAALSEPSPTVELIRDEALFAAARASVLLCRGGTSAEQARRFAEHLELVNSSRIRADVKLQLIAYIQENVDRTQALANLDQREASLRDRCQTLQTTIKSNAGGSIPLIPIGMGVLFLLAARISGFFILIGLCLLGYAGFRVYQRSVRTRAISDLAAAEAELNAIGPQRNQLIDVPAFNGKSLALVRI